MSLETSLDPRIWSAIQQSIENRNYTAAIIDATFFLTSLIQERSGIQADGVALIGQAFGGDSPKLKVNRLQTESDWNEQKGVEQLLRGYLTAIRNPRSHEKRSDTIEDATAIILFVNYLTKIIDQSKAPFTKHEFLARVFDPMFVENDKYAELLVREVPTKLRLEMFMEAYAKKEKGIGRKLKFFFYALQSVLTEEEKRQVYSHVSEELKNTDSTEVIRLTLQIWPPDTWVELEEVARMRTENRLIESIRTGEYYESSNKCNKDGALGTWGQDIVKHFLMKSELLQALLQKLDSADYASSGYVLKYFALYLPNIYPNPSPAVIRVLKAGLKRGDKRFRKLISFYESFDLGAWVSPLQTEIRDFVEVEQEQGSVDSDDLPF